MLKIERLEKMTEYINQNGTASIQELMNAFEVSKPTVVRDLNELDEQNLINRAHGGAISIKKGTRFEPKNKVKENEAIEKKEAIAEVAKEYIFPGETILLDSGSTTLMLAKKLIDFENITVITNDLKIAMTLSENNDIELVVIGGQKRKGVYSLIGPFAEHILSQLNIDKVFLGTDAIDLEAGLTNSNIEEMTIKQTMIKSAKERILLADSRKFNQLAFTKVASVHVLDKVVSDNGLSDQDKKQMEDIGIEILIANSEGG